MRKLLLTAALLMLAVQAAQARAWKPQGAVLAQDYSVISDTRPDHNLIVVFWLAAPMMEKFPTAQALLDKYVILGVAHGQFDAVSGQLTFESEETAQALDTEGKPLKLLEGDAIPPGVSAAIAGMGGVMRQSMGAMGQGIHFFAFESGNIRACGGKGRLSVAYVGETYTYDTPMPGCPAP